MPNEGSVEELEHFAISIDSVEKITGLDFFHLLPDEQENVIESVFNLNDWSWSPLKQYDTKSSIQQSNSADTLHKHNLNVVQTHENKDDVEKSNLNSVQCSGKTKKGARCKNLTKNISGKCYLHE